MEKVKEKSSFFRKFVGDKEILSNGACLLRYRSWYRTESQILSVFWTIL